MSEFAIRWLGVVSFELLLGGRHIVVDPFITDAPYNGGLTADVIEGADLLLLSHSHWDHIMDIPQIVKKYDPLLLTGEKTAYEMMEWLDCAPSRVYPMAPGMVLDFDFARVQALFGRHTNLHKTVSELRAHFAQNPLLKQRNDPRLFDLQITGSMEYRNFLLTTPAGTRILFWGNDPTPEQRNLLRDIRPDVACLQFSVQRPDEMARFACDIGAKCFIPHHMDLKRPRAEYQPLVDALRGEVARIAPDMRFLQPEHNVWYAF